MKHEFAEARNPFATRYTRPGAIDFLFPSGDSAEGLVARLSTGNWWGAILGPHGAGKSTLLRTLEPALERAGRQPVLFTLNEKQRTLEISSSTSGDWSASTQVLVDGYEQLSWWGRWRLKTLCRRRSAGLLVTAHQSVDLPEIYRVAPAAADAQRVVTHLLSSVGREGEIAELIHAGDVTKAFDRQQGNIREALFELYDLYRHRLPGSERPAE
jgi:energy-coupling factor transporter ATP-binding protein EcfA2